MPWRTDFVQCLWLDPDWVGLSGYPNAEKSPPASIEDSAPRHVKRSYITSVARTPPRRPLAAAVIAVRDRIGFRYEREVGLDDFVSIRDAAQLIDLPVMTVSRWVKKREMKSSKRKRFAVIRLREVLRIARERKRKLKLGSRLVVIG